eukprot:CAMPEP_0202977318 /NCGR_PEP_ID=MMETSP1396-20130829/84182_1 /ASSEMBLY_ACC=CAM_ASM_000872 /TAXON_ID= /ORGANISM="Pseudokeronopsis sp., Strain Brazil" /LENGTH=67 /DNA_ID=CAMNT_0049716049 /DNA_START=30 /DNA_END=233 /DNA_ORIENTATION=-
MKEKFESFFAKLQENAGDLGEKLGATKDKAESFLSSNSGLQDKAKEFFNQAEIEAIMKTDIESMNTE